MNAIAFADFMYHLIAALPFHLQHELDGGSYISSALDFSADLATGRNNVGLPRLKLRDRRAVHSYLYSPSRIKEFYKLAFARG